MRVRISKHLDRTTVARLKKKARIRKRVEGSSERPRLCVFRSNKHIYAQLIDDGAGVTLASASSLEKDAVGCNKNNAKLVGSEIAKIAKSKGIENVVFDRNGYLYHGKVQTLADAAREAGLKF